MLTAGADQGQEKGPGVAAACSTELLSLAVFTQRLGQTKTARNAEQGVPPPQRDTGSDESISQAPHKADSWGVYD